MNEFHSQIPEDMLRHYRRRVYRCDDGLLLIVDDTLEVPFEADGFPIGTLLFETVHLDEEQADNDFMQWLEMENIYLGGSEGTSESLVSPAETYRCRIFEVASAKRSGAPIFFEVWDTVEEPMEYRDEMPGGQLRLTLLHFSQILLARQVHHREECLGMVDVRTWSTTRQA